MVEHPGHPELVLGLFPEFMVAGSVNGYDFKRVRFAIVLAANVYDGAMSAAAESSQNLKMANAFRHVSFFTFSDAVE
jgi:hypothetical protein